MKTILILASLALILNCTQNKKVDSLPLNNIHKKPRESYITNTEARKKFVEIFQSPQITKNIKLFYSAMWKLGDEYPEEMLIQIHKAALLGDYGQTLTATKERQYKVRAVEIIRPYLDKKFESEIGLDRIITFNEFYYHSRNYLGQLSFGESINKKGGEGDFSIGVGASMHALSLDQDNKCKEAQHFAKKSRNAWFSTTKESRKTLNTNPFYIAALAITGKRKEAQKLFNNELKKTDDWKLLKRWYSQFNPKYLQCSFQAH